MSGITIVSCKAENTKYMNEQNMKNHSLNVCIYHNPLSLNYAIAH